MPGARPDPTRRPTLGYGPEDFETPFAKYFSANMAPLAAHVVEALNVGAVSPKLIGGPDTAASLLDEGDQVVETGFALARDGSARVAVRTEMPEVTPEMWDWWFGWHGCDSRRYKLWHPRAHLYAEWDDGPDAGRRGRDRYVGRTSFVDEYLGSTLVRAAIGFVPPAEAGLDEELLADAERQTAVCAVLGSSKFPVNVGSFVHHVRRTARGSEMRSRFWMGGLHVELRSDRALVRSGIPPVARRLLRPTARSAAELLVHCAQEMSHLASFLPSLYEEFKDF